MIKHQVVLPFVYQEYGDACFATMSRKLETLLVDNTRDNIGVAESWNRGIDAMRASGADWLIVVGASMRFGKKSGVDMLEQIDKHRHAHVINFAVKDFPPSDFVRGESVGVEGGNFSWHCTAIRKDVIEKVGYFDPNFYPIYFEDIDYDLRINKAIPDRTWLILPIDATDVGVGHGAKLAGVKSPSEPLIAYYATKWGSHPNARRLGTYDYPFNLDHGAIGYFPPAQGRVWDE